MKPIRILFLASLLAATISCTERKPSTVGATPEVERRVDQLLSRMTLAEKIGQMNQVSAGGEVANYADALRKGQIGSILNEVDPVKVNEFQRICVEESRLGIPLLVGRDVDFRPRPRGGGRPRGLRRGDRAGGPMDLLAHAGHRPGPALGPDRGRKRRGHLAGRPDGRGHGPGLSGNGDGRHIHGGLHQAFRRLRRRGRRAGLQQHVPDRASAAQCVPASFRGGREASSS